MLLLTATSAAPNSMGRAVPERQVLLPRSTALRQESSPTYAAKLAKPCVSLVPNVRDGWCERNCRVDNCPSGVCSCDGSTTSASVVKAPTGHPFAAVSKNASVATSARSFTVAQLPEESIGFCEPAPFLRHCGQTLTRHTHADTRNCERRYEGMVVHGLGGGQPQYLGLRRARREKEHQCVLLWSGFPREGSQSLPRRVSRKCRKRMQTRRPALCAAASLEPSTSRLVRSATHAFGTFRGYVCRLQSASGRDGTVLG